jgi:hypothetical protein
MGYTSFLRGPSQKVATFRFHVENRVEIDILRAAAEGTFYLLRHHDK